MPVSDPIADLLTRVRNAQHSRALICSCPWSRHKEEMMQLLKKEGYFSDVVIAGEGKEKTITLHFAAERPPLILKRVSKPGRRIYMGKKELKPIMSGMGLSIVTTSQGLMTDREARAKGVGGEVLCTIC